MHPRPNSPIDYIYRRLMALPAPHDTIALAFAGVSANERVVDPPDLRRGFADDRSPGEIVLAFGTAIAMSLLGAPTQSSPTYNTGTTINVNDVSPTGTDLSIRTLAVDAAGNEQADQFDYVINRDQPPVTATDFREETIYFLKVIHYNLK